MNTTSPVNVDLDDIASKSLLVRLRIGIWSNSRHDRNADERIREQSGAEYGSAKVYKRLVKSKTLKLINRNGESARLRHRTLTMPWLDDNYRIIAGSVLEKHGEEMDGFAHQRTKLVDEFVDEDYAVCVRAAESELGTLFDPNDYPDPSTLRRKFHFSYFHYPVVSDNDWRVQYDEDRKRKLVENTHEHMVGALQDAMKDLWRRVYDRVSHARDTLADPDKIFRDTTIGHMVELSELIPQMNLLGDPDIEQFADEISAKLCQFDPSDLRSSGGNKTWTNDRRMVADAADDILRRMGQMGKLPSDDEL